MADSKLYQQTQGLFKKSLELSAESSQLDGLNETLKQCAERLDQPMRVAIVGFIKAGKSTAMNALLGDNAVATGPTEKTFNVNWLKWGESPSLLLKFKDGRAPEQKPFSELEALTVREGSDRIYDEHYLHNIKYIEVFNPNPLLKIFNLIDTPGLKSFYEDDSRNTTDFLHLHGDELSEVTREEAAQADATLYLFQKSMRLADKSFVEQFQDDALGQPTPINAIGVLTKVDTYWSDGYEPLEKGEEIAKRLREDSQVRGVFYTVKPIAGLLAAGAQTLTAEEFVILNKLAELPVERFESLLKNASRFIRPYDDLPVSETERQAVSERLGLYGISLARQLIEEGLKTREQLSEKLLDYSGLPELRKLIISHFGNRAFLIKLSSCLRQIKVACFNLKQKTEGRELEIIEEIYQMFEDLEDNEIGFHTLSVLRSFYEGKLHFDEDEIRQLLDVTGETGNFAAERLGLDPDSSINKILETAEKRFNYWHRKANGFPTGGRDTVVATHILARAFEQIFVNARKAKEYLSF